MSPRVARAVLVLLFIVVGAALYELRAGAIPVFLYLLGFSIILTARSRGALQNFGLTATTIVAILLIATLLTTLREPHLVSTTTKLDKPEANFYARSPIVGWGPGAPGRYRARRVLNDRLVYDAVYTIDHDLLRKVESGNNGKGIAFVGDSYIFGEGLQDSETLPQLFADLERRAAPVYDLGFAAYSPAQALAGIRTGLYDKQLTNARLIVEFVTAWHAERVSCKAAFVADAPRFVQIDTRIVQEGTCPPIPQSPLAYFSIFRFIHAMTPVVRDSDIALFTAVTQEVVRLARRKYKIPVVIYYLRSPAYLRRLREWNDDRIMRDLRAAGAEVLEYDFPAGPEYSIQGDGHPTRLENANCARKLFAFLREKFPGIETAGGR